MKNTLSPRTAASLTLAALAFVLAGASAPAHSSQDVVVEVSRSETMYPRSSTGRPVEIISITRSVPYADLNLVTHAGVTALERRISNTAKVLCRQLGKRYRMPTSDEQSCVTDAVAGAMVQARTAIAAAEGRARVAELDTAK